MNDELTKQIRTRFDGYLPVVVDVETTGVDFTKHGLLEIAAVLVDYNNEGKLAPTATDFWHIAPFKEALIDPKAMAVNKIDHTHPFRFAKPEAEALTEFFAYVDKAVKATRCRRAVLVGHNAHFDLNFIMAGAKRCNLSNIPLHAFTCIDTATLGGVFYGKTVLAKALKKARIEFDKNEAHSAVYDAEKTAELFCQVINNLHSQLKNGAR
ncbi:MAG: ribonuclease T [Coxiella sp. (in: Bacteria)]|nr:MAG: ribonuclease T [Coxiella sp. (in: g-proteobacteria)]